MTVKTFVDIDDALFHVLKDSAHIGKFKNLGLNAWVVGNSKKFLKVGFDAGSHHGYYHYIYVEIYNKGTRSDRYTFRLHPNTRRHFHEPSCTFGPVPEIEPNWYPKLGYRVDELIEFHEVLK